MLKKSIFFHLSVAIFYSPLFSVQVTDYKQISWINSSVTQSNISEHFAIVRDQVKDRWHAFQTNRVFKPFESGTQPFIFAKKFLMRR